MKFLNFLLLFLVTKAFAEHCTFNIYRVSLDYDKEYLNVDHDFSMYEKSTPQKPVDIVPDMKVTVLKPISDHALTFQLFFNDTSMNTSKYARINQKINFCDAKSKGDGRFRAIFRMLIEFGKINLKCAQKKGDEMIIKKIRIRDVPLTRLYTSCYKSVETVIVKLIEDKKVQHELMSLSFEYQVVDVPSN